MYAGGVFGIVYDKMEGGNMRVAMILIYFFLILIGTIIGGVLGLLTGLGALAIPGLGPMVAAGTLATVSGTAGVGVIIGILVGGLLGVLLNLIIDRTRLRE